MLNVFIVRHGQTDTNKVAAINGSGTDLPLNKLGKQQVETLRDSFDINKIDYIYASPLTRARQTAEILAQGQLEVNVDERLKEIYFGNWDGQSIEEIQEKYPQAFDELGYFKENYVDYCTGESYQHMADRLMDFWHELVNNHEHESVLLVCHGIASRTLVQTLLGIPSMTEISLIQNAAVINLTVDDQTKKVFLRYYNRIAPGKFFIEDKHGTA